jgi:hypothetical protein
MTESSTDMIKTPEVHIIDNKGAPPELIRIARQYTNYPTVEEIIFDAFIEELDGSIGAFSPKTKTIIVDMGNCLINKTWMKKGIMYITNVWFNLTTSIFHEIEHANQLSNEPELAELTDLPDIYERKAAETAQQMLTKWLFNNNIPNINEMGWAGQHIKLLFNKLYSSIPETINEEISLQGTNIAARAIDAAIADKNYDAEETTKLLKQIDKDDGFVGKKVDGIQYLTAYEVIDMGS